MIIFYFIGVSFFFVSAFAEPTGPANSILDRRIDVSTRLKSSCEKIEIQIKSYMDNADIALQASKKKDPKDGYNHLKTSIMQRREQAIALLAGSFSDIGKLLQDKDMNCKISEIYFQFEKYPQNNKCGYRVYCSHHILGMFDFQTQGKIALPKKSLPNAPQLCEAPTLSSISSNYSKQASALKSLDCKVTDINSGDVYIDSKKGGAAR